MGFGCTYVTKWTRRELEQFLGYCTLHAVQTRPHLQNTAHCTAKALEHLRASKAKWTSRQWHAAVSRWKKSRTTKQQFNLRAHGGNRQTNELESDVEANIKVARGPPSGGKWCHNSFSL